MLECPHDKIANAENALLNSCTLENSYLMPRVLYESLFNLMEFKLQSKDSKYYLTSFYELLV